MWDDRPTTLVDEIEQGLRDEEGVFESYEDELTEINEGMSYGLEHVGSDTLTTPNNEERKQNEAAVATIMVLLALFTIKHNLPAEAIGNLLSLISLVLPSSHALPNTASKFKVTPNKKLYARCVLENHHNLYIVK